MTDAELRAKYPNRAEWFYRQMLEQYNTPRGQLSGAGLSPAKEKTHPRALMPVSGTPPAKRVKRASTSISADYQPHERPQHFCAYVPIPIRSEANGRELWHVKQAKVRRQRQAVALFLGRDLRGRAKPETIALVRCGRNGLDGDNLMNSFKHVRDEIAELLGFDDRDPDVEWLHEQINDNLIGFAVSIRWPKPVCPCCGRSVVSI